MTDRYGRKIEYLRLSITERCNMNCAYCSPVCDSTSDEILSQDELVRICEAAAEQGITKIRITGGEPLMRRDCCEIVRRIKSIPNVERVYITTNGTMLSRFAHELKKAGIDGVNVSLDTTDPDEYKAITGRDMLYAAVSGIDTAYSLDIPVKLNCVTTSMTSHDTITGLLRYPQSRAIDLRFIELMPLGEGKNLTFKSNDDIFREIDKLHPLSADSYSLGGPSVYFTSPSLKGRIGFINAVSHKFCSSCNRLRITSDGIIKPCLCYSGDIDIKPAVHNKELIKDALMRAVSEKPYMHCFDDTSRMTEKKTMNTIGG